MKQLNTSRSSSFGFLSGSLSVRIAARLLIRCKDGLSNFSSRTSLLHRSALPVSTVTSTPATPDSRHAALFRLSSPASCYLLCRASVHGHSLPYLPRGKLDIDNFMETLRFCTKFPLALKRYQLPGLALSESSDQTCVRSAPLTARYPTQNMSNALPWCDASTWNE